MKKLVILIICIACQNYVSAQWYKANTNTFEDIEDMYFQNSSIGYAVTKNHVIYTIDGGENWSILFSDSVLFSKMSIVVTSDSIYVFCQDSLGVNYKLTFDDTSNDYNKKLISFNPRNPVCFNENILFIQNSTIKKWNNGNITTVLTFPGLQYFYVQNGFISAASATHIYCSLDSGLTWDTIQFTTSPLSSPPYQSYFNGSDTILAVTNYPTILYYSYDAGLSWNFHHTPTIVFYFINGKTLLGLSLYSINDNIVAISSNGGQAFIADTLLYPIQDCYIYSKTLGFVYGDNGIIYKNTNIAGQVGIKENENMQKKIKVYPNPAKGIITIEISKGISVNTIKLSDIQGKIVKSYSPNERYLNISGVASGQYLLQLQTSEGNVSKKVIIE